ncbi:hypothetical protein GCM10027597_62060 [Saccharopolyspora tripterygii]
MLPDPHELAALTFAASGTAVVTANLAFNSRGKNDRGEWEDDAVHFQRSKASAGSPSTSSNGPPSRAKKRSAAVLLLDGVRT